MANGRKICVVTDSRAEYGHMRWLCHDIAAAPGLELQNVVTGGHLAPHLHYTYKVLEADGLTVDWKVESLLAADTPVAIGKSMGLCLQGMAEAFDHLEPEIVVILGDRYEMLAAASAAMIACIPIAHIHGGERTEGAMDEGIRHAITKLSHLHFCAAAPYRDRLIQLGEDPERIYNFGAPGLDHLQRTPMLPREEMEELLGMRFGPQVFLVTYHPVTLRGSGQEQRVRGLLAALDAFPEASVIITGVNVDTYHAAVSGPISEWASARPERVKVIASLGQQRYFSMMHIADAVIGNSSSGIIEAPAIPTATVNIGERQAGRLRAMSIIDTGETEAEILAGIERALSPEFREIVRQTESVYGQGDASRRIVDVLRDVDLDDILIKKFRDLTLAGTGTM